MPFFNALSRKFTPEIVHSRKKIFFQILQASWQTVDILYVITGKLLAEGTYIFVNPNESDQ